jgi:hypothetical protein
VPYHTRLIIPPSLSNVTERGERKYKEGFEDSLFWDVGLVRTDVSEELVTPSSG